MHQEGKERIPFLLHSLLDTTVTYWHQGWEMSSIWELKKNEKQSEELPVGLGHTNKVIGTICLIILLSSKDVTKHFRLCSYAIRAHGHQIHYGAGEWWKEREQRKINSYLLKRWGKEHVVQVRSRRYEKVVQPLPGFFLYVKFCNKSLVCFVSSFPYTIFCHEVSVVNNYPSKNLPTNPKKPQIYTPILEVIDSAPRWKLHLYYHTPAVCINFCQSLTVLWLYL